MPVIETQIGELQGRVAQLEGLAKAQEKQLDEMWGLLAQAAVEVEVLRRRLLCVAHCSEEHAKKLDLG